MGHMGEIRQVDDITMLTFGRLSLHLRGFRIARWIPTTPGSHRKSPKRTCRHASRFSAGSAKHARPGLQTIGWGNRVFVNGALPQPSRADILHSSPFNGNIWQWVGGSNGPTTFIRFTVKDEIKHWKVDDFDSCRSDKKPLNFRAALQPRVGEISGVRAQGAPFAALLMSMAMRRLLSC